MLKKFKWVIYTEAFVRFAYYLIHIYSRTLKLSVINERKWQAQLGKRPVLLCTWHQQFFGAIRHFGNYAGYNPGLMISRSKDGDLISSVARKTGWKTPRGSSSRGGKQAMGEMIRHLEKYGFGAHILDGPTGPIGIVKPGVIKMAESTGAVIVPFHVKALNAWYFNSWDRFMLPKPFSKVEIIFDDPMQLDAIVDPGDFEQQRLGLEEKMKPHLVLGR